MKETVKTKKYVSKNATAKSLTMFKITTEDQFKKIADKLFASFSKEHGE